MQHTFAYLIFFTLYISNTYCQEICNDGIDNNENGLIDFYDRECIESEDCKDFFYSTHYVSDSTCTTTPTYDATFQLKELWRTSHDFIVPHSTPLCGDINGDGVTEVFVSSGLMLNGRTGEIIKSSSEFLFELAIGDVDEDGYAEFYSWEGYQFIARDHNFNVLWKSNLRSSAIFPAYGIANFNYDDTAEVYNSDIIRNAITGEVVTQCPDYPLYAMPIAADVLDSSDTCPDCSGLELVAANKVYSIDVKNKKATLRTQAPSHLPIGLNAIADINFDGKLDIIVGGVINTNYIGSDGTLYIWDPRTEQQLGQQMIEFPILKSQPNVGNFDADSLIEIAIGGKGFFSVWSYDPTLDMIIEKWRVSTDEGSGRVGSSAFDFNCDGMLDIVYRDETNLYIFKGDDGNILASYPCSSGTRYEMPIVADVNNDGSAEIICNCATSITNYLDGYTIALTNEKGNWPPTRHVFNQTNYFGVNINDDLTIPKQQQNHAHPDLAPLNTFLNQPSLFDELGNRICKIGLPDASLTIDTICLPTVTLTICNEDENVILPENISIELFMGDSIHGTLIKSVKTDTIILPEECRQFTFDIPNEDYILYAYLDDTTKECLKDNNKNSATISLINDSTSITGLNSFYCPGDSVITLTGHPSGGAFSGNGISNNQFNRANLIPGSYIIEYTYEDMNSCIRTIEDSTIIYSTSFEFPPDRTICFGSSTVLAASGGENYQWKPDTTLSDLSSSNPSAVPKETTPYILTITDSNSCQLTDTILVEVDSTIEIYLEDTFIVLGGCINLENIFSSENIIDIRPNTETMDEKLCPTALTSYIIILEDTNGCLNNVFINIDVIPEPIFNMPMSFLQMEMV